MGSLTTESTWEAVTPEFAALFERIQKKLCPGEGLCMFPSGTTYYYEDKMLCVELLKDVSLKIPEKIGKTEWLDTYQLPPSDLYFEEVYNEETQVSQIHMIVARRPGGIVLEPDGLVLEYRDKKWVPIKVTSHEASPTVREWAYLYVLMRELQTIVCMRELSKVRDDTEPLWQV